MDFEPFGGMSRWPITVAAAVLSLICAATTRPAFPALALQVALDRDGFSPGQIDGRNGTFTSRAQAAYLDSRKAAIMPSADPLTQYTITDADVTGPYIDQIPKDMEEQAKLE